MWQFVDVIIGGFIRVDVESVGDRFFCCQVLEDFFFEWRSVDIFKVDE